MFYAPNTFTVMNVIMCIVMVQLGTRVTVDYSDENCALNRNTLLSCIHAVRTVVGGL